MRMLVKVRGDIAAGSKAIQEQRIQGLLQSGGEMMKPEAGYFGLEDGRRTMWFFFDVDDARSLPQVAELFFQELGAEVYITPVLTAEELAEGLNGPGEPPQTVDEIVEEATRPLPPR